MSETSRAGGPPADKRVAITGISVLAPGNPGREAFWSLITSGGSGVRRISRFDPSRFRSQIAGECDVDDEAIAVETDGNDADAVDRSIRLAIIATDEALRDAFQDELLTDEYSGRIGISYGSAVGRSLRMVDLFDHFTDKGGRWLCPFGSKEDSLFEGLLPSTLGARLANRHDASGPASVVSAGARLGWTQSGRVPR